MVGGSTLSSSFIEILQSGGLLSFGLHLFFLGCAGIVFPISNVIVLLMSIELILLGINVMFVGVDLIWDDAIGQLFALFVLTVAAAESAIGLAILIAYSQTRGGLDRARPDVILLRS
jgi:NADH-quinone oxidoreductase subunit K